MTETLKVEIELVAKSRLAATDFDNLPFGMVYTDHMFICDFQKGQWENPRIVPYGYLPMSPASPAIHYGQSIFEGIKAHRSPSGDVLIFRPQDNWMRMNISAHRMCMPDLPEELFMESLRELISLDRDWIPKSEGASLYIRPFMFSADEYIGIRPSQRFTYMVILSPVGPYYSSPVRVKIEEHYTRAVAGGTGYAKAGGNYGGSIYPAKLAQDEGYHQLIWTDGREHKYIEESGTMNVMFVVDDTLITPALSDSILAGITRDSVLTIAREWEMKVEEKRISVDEIIEALKSGRVKEAFGAGTAATIAHISTIGYQGTSYELPVVEKRIFSNNVFRELNAIKYGLKPDTRGWTYRLS
jgi:branched-chain amino acid aminotransferase